MLCHHTLEIIFRYGRRFLWLLKLISYMTIYTLWRSLGVHVHALKKEGGGERLGENREWEGRKGRKGERKKERKKEKKERRMERKERG